MWMGACVYGDHGSNFLDDTAAPEGDVESRMLLACSSNALIPFSFFASIRFKSEQPIVYHADMIGYFPYKPHISVRHYTAHAYLRIAPLALHQQIGPRSVKLGINHHTMHRPISMTQLPLPLLGRSFFCIIFGILSICSTGN